MHPPIDIIGGQVKRPARAKAFRPSSDESRQKNDADDAATRAAADAAAKARADAAARARAEAEAGGGGGGGVAGHDGWNAASLMMMTPRTRARLLAAGSQQQAGAETGKIRDRRRHWDMKTWRPIGLGPPPRFTPRRSVSVAPSLIFLLALACGGRTKVGSSSCVYALVQYCVSKWSTAGCTVGLCWVARVLPIGVATAPPTALSSII